MYPAKVLASNDGHLAPLTFIGK